MPKPPKPVSIAKVKPTSTKSLHPYTRKPGHAPPGRTYKMKARRGRNMTLNNTRSYPYVISILHLYAVMICSRRSSRRSTIKRINKYVDKPCPRFTTTGTTCFLSSTPQDSANEVVYWPWGVGLFLSHLYNVHILFFPFSVLFLWTTTTSRYLQPRVDMHVSTRPSEDRHLLAFPARQLPQHRGDMQSISRPNTGEDATLRALP